MLKQLFSQDFFNHEKKADNAFDGKSAYPPGSIYE